ncbi:MAG: hypothetical protein AVDCRST_MAG30-1906 [uncultured Solirubrobacteraceae bacterium]|uniref:RDD domain-containing protein n=1 Tax=uncultured Solirubrobacteraceae bacterium TaxID=1162706 RepID=A0A6J4SPU1_9ACTN|nr:MAG: hypothetical protein AVDCRST_MAG30-1906 [uncultured Solirubrobacteraceae bacterium]
MQYEDRLTISTPEGVDLELTLAGIGSRFTASLIDHTIQFALVAVAIGALLGLSALDVGPSGVEADDGSSGALATAAVTLFGFAVFWGYDVLFEVRGGGRTPGKRLTGLRVVRAGGRPVGFVASGIRNVLRVVDILPGFYGLAMAVMFGTPRNQRLGDIAAGTVVVRERKGGRRQAATEAPGARALPDTAGWDVSGVGAQDIAVVRRFLERRSALAEGPRAELAADIASRVRPRVAGAPADLGPEPFLEALSAAKAARA